MKYIYSFSIILLFIFGCSDPIKIDLQNYSSQLKRITELEDNALNRWNSVSGANFVNDGYMYQALDTYIIDTYSQFVNKLGNLTLQTKEVKELNSMYVQAAEKQLDGFEMMKDGLEKRNKDTMSKAYQLLTEGRAAEKDWAVKFDRLTKSH